MSMDVPPHPCPSLLSTILVHWPELQKVMLHGWTWMGSPGKDELGRGKEGRERRNGASGR